MDRTKTKDIVGHIALYVTIKSEYLNSILTDTVFALNIAGMNITVFLDYNKKASTLVPTL
ncbi:hypothetical protein [Streptococcus suis]